MTARDIFEIAFDLAVYHEHGVKDFRACPRPSCQALARIAGPVKEADAECYCNSRRHTRSDHPVAGCIVDACECKEARTDG